MGVGSDVGCAVRSGVAIVFWAVQLASPGRAGTQAELSVERLWEQSAGSARAASPRLAAISEAAAAAAAVEVELCWSLNRVAQCNISRQFLVVFVD